MHVAFNVMHFGHILYASILSACRESRVRERKSQRLRGGRAAEEAKLVIGDMRVCISLQRTAGAPNLLLQMLH